MATTTDNKISCYHCGETCKAQEISIGNRSFCCEGCKMVFQLLNENGLCDYYQLNDRPGITRRINLRKDKFAFLDDEKIAARLIVFKNEDQSHITFYLPQIHCSSCLYLLENLHRLDTAITSSRVDFAARSVFIVFDHKKITLRKVADLLAAIGYEPYISLHDLGQKRPTTPRAGIYRLGIAGFCFANIMLLSFPEYLGLNASERSMQLVFRTLNMLLSLPVLLYCAQPFYQSSWKSLRHKFLNIDTPIVLAIFITFARSAYEVLSGTGPGYFDSLTGIVFFMLAGRMLQEKTYRQLSFERDYTAWFPIAVSIVQEGKELPRTLPELRCGDTLLIHNEELIPADGILTRGEALIDYSFVTGESLPVLKEPGELVYAGGRHIGANIEILVVKEVTQSYLTQLWNRHEKKPASQRSAPRDTTLSEKAPADTVDRQSFVQALSRYFTYIVLAIAALTACYWWAHDPSQIIRAVSAVLIVACPCALLLSTTFTDGNILQVLARNRFYLRNAQVIGNIADTTHIVFDKTGTLTIAGGQELIYEGVPLTDEQQQAIALLAAQSTHPLSRSLAKHLDKQPSCHLLGFRELPGKGITGFVNGKHIAIGSRSYVTGKFSPDPAPSATRVYIAYEYQLLGFYNFINHYREGLSSTVKDLSPRFRLSLLSGDNAWEQLRLQQILGQRTRLRFEQSPEDKTRYIAELQRQGEKVMMIGDGLNDAGALLQSHTGIAISENTNTFTPASDVIMDAAQLYRLPLFIRFCRMEKKIIIASFILSLVYNIIGLSFAVKAVLSPMVAAMLMPASSLSILLLTYGCSSLAAKALRL